MPRAKWRGASATQKRSGRPSRCSARGSRSTDAAGALYRLEKRLCPGGHRCRRSRPAWCRVTQFGRMCAALGMQHHCGEFAAGQGPVERNHGTHQDRLVKKLRRLALADDVAVNHYLTTTYWPAHNARFAQAPAAARDFHRACPDGPRARSIFRLEETRVVGPGLGRPLPQPRVAGGAAERPRAGAQHGDHL